MPKGKKCSLTKRKTIIQLMLISPWVQSQSSNSCNRCFKPSRITLCRPWTISKNKVCRCLKTKKMMVHPTHCSSNMNIWLEQVRVKCMQLLSTYKTQYQQDMMTFTIQELIRELSVSISHFIFFVNVSYNFRW